MSISDLLSGPENDSPIQAVNGVMVGVVTNNKDPEGFARVKLSLPMQEGQNETNWTRIATMMAGKNRGSLFIPEVGDEVLVAFHLGDVTQPYVIGMLWSEKQPSPKSDDKNNIRKIKTRSGHEIIFDDDDSKGKITIKTNKAQSIELDDEKDIIKINEKSGNNMIQISGGSKNEITIKSQTSVITMNSKGDISLSSDKALKLKSLEVNIEASAQMNIKAGAALNLKSDGLITIKGSMVKIN